jgi:hypothetical protein
MSSKLLITLVAAVASAADAAVPSYLTAIGGEAKSIAFDPAGNVYITGYAGGDIFVSKLNPAGAILHTTTFGGSGHDAGIAIALDSDGNIYVAGVTSSTDFPTINAFQRELNRRSASGINVADVFVAKLDAGFNFVYSTLLGGSWIDTVWEIAVDGAGNVSIVGNTLSDDFPIHNAMQTRLSRGGRTGDAFVAKLDATGSALIFSTYLGGAADETASGIAADAQGNTYVVGTTDSMDFPVHNALQASRTACPCAPSGCYCSDVFASKFDAAGRFVYSTYLGGSSYEHGKAVAASNDGSALIAGNTLSSDFPLMRPMQSVLSGGYAPDAFIAKIAPDGSQLLFSTYAGGSYIEDLRALAVDSTGGICIAGLTWSADFPIEKGMRSREPSSVSCGWDESGCLSDLFVAKFDANGETLTFSTYVGGEFAEWIGAIALDPAGNPHLSGFNSFPPGWFAAKFDLPSAR